MEAGRERVGKGMEGERCVGLETGRGRIAVRGFGEPGRRYKRYMHSQHLHSDDAMPFGWCQRMGRGNCVAVDERECSSGYQSTS